MLKDSGKYRRRLQEVVRIHYNIDKGIVAKKWIESEGVLRGIGKVN